MAGAQDMLSKGGTGFKETSGTALREQLFRLFAADGAAGR
jgi:hypothetical protein